MKKLLFFIVCMCLSCLLSTDLKAAGYQGFEHIEMSEGKMLIDYTQKDYDRYYKNVHKLKLQGWSVYVVHQHVKATFVSETLFSYYNDGYTAIEYDYKLERKKSSKLGLSATGSIAIKVNQTIPKFKNNLESSLKLSADYQLNHDEKENHHLKFLVDPGTQVNLYLYGEGRVTNGVAARYSLFIRVEKGGFEVFVVTTEYQRLEKKKL